MRNIITTFFLFTFVIFADSEYIFLDEYQKLYPKQQALMEQFALTVKDDVKKLATTQNKRVKIVMVYPGNQISDYWRRSKDAFTKRLDEIGIEYELVDHFTKPFIEIKEQAKYLNEALKDNTDYLIFTLDANKHKLLIERIIAKNKTKVILQNITTPLKSLQSNQAFMYVGFDHQLGTKEIANEYINSSKKDSKYAVMYAGNGYISKMRGDEFIKYIKENSDFQLSGMYYTDFKKDKAKNATLDLLQRTSDIDFIYSCSTDITIGVIEALKQKGLLGKIKVNGWGGGEAELNLIENGELDFTIMRINDDNGVAMAEAIKNDLEQKTESTPLIFSGDFKIVKKGMQKDKISSYKKIAFRYSDR